MRLVGPALLGCALVFSASAVLARTDAGDLLWQDQFDLAGGEDVAWAVAASSGRVVVVGSAQNAAGNSDFVVRAYDAKTGSLLWQDVVDVAGGSDSALAVVMDNDRVFVGGNGVDAAGRGLLLVRAYVAKNGNLAWQDRSLLASFSGLAIGGSRVVVAGTTADSIGDGRLIVRAYAAKNGSLDWEDRPALPAGFGRFDGPTRGVTVQGQRVFVAGTVTRLAPAFDPSCLVRAYAIADGRLKWESLHLPPSSCIARAIATDGKRVIVAARGATGLDDFLAQAYDAETGQFLWEDRTFVSTGLSNEAAAADVERRQAFFVGWVRSVRVPGNKEEFLVRAYDAETGVLNWEDQFLNCPTCSCHANDVVAENRRVIAVGSGSPGWLVRAYDSKRGDLIWSDEFAPVGGVRGFMGALAVAAANGRVFVAGSGLNASGNADFFVRAYDAK
jgi:hypothetical protein